MENPSSSIDNVNYVNYDRVDTSEKLDLPTRRSQTETDSRRAEGKFLEHWTHKKLDPSDTGRENIYPPAGRQIASLKKCHEEEKLYKSVHRNCPLEFAYDFQSFGAHLETGRSRKLCAELILPRVIQDFIRVQTGPSRQLLTVTLAKLLAGRVKQKSWWQKPNCQAHWKRVLAAAGTAPVGKNGEKNFEQ
jgi:hypothetical protein